MFNNRTTGSLAFAFVIAASLPAYASPADCDAVAAAFTQLATVPAFQEVIEQDGTKLEAIIIGEDMHIKMDGAWQKLPMLAGGRAKMFESVFDIVKVQDCSTAADETLDGRNMKVFDYVVPAVEGVTTEPSPQRVWIGADDGLPYQSTNPTGKIVISYESVVAPTY